MTPDAPPEDELLAPPRPRWWGTTPAVTPPPRWANWQTRRPSRTAWFDRDAALGSSDWRRLAVWLGAVPLGLVVANFGLLLAGDAYRVFPVHPWVNDLYNAAGRGLIGDAAVMSLCSVPATVAGCAWLAWRGYGTAAAWRAAAVYAVVGGAWLLGCGVATVTVFREMT